MMDEHERRFTAFLLELAADRFANHVCNDLPEWSQFFTPEKRDELYRQYCDWNGDPEEYHEVEPGESDYRFMDFMAMSFMAARLRGEIK